MFKTANSRSTHQGIEDLDRKLMLLLYGDPRISLNDIAGHLGISRQAAHHRMKVLERLGVFKNTRAMISGHYFGVIPVAIWGRSESTPVERALDRLAESNLTSCVRVAGGNELFVMASLRSVSELDGYVEFVRREAEMSDPTVGMVCFGDGINPESFDGWRRKERYGRLTSLDFKIVTSLQENARKPSADIAQELGVSAKTVRRHLSSMISDHSLVFVQPLDLASGEDMLTMLYLDLRSGSNKVKVGRRLIAKDPLHIVYFRSFSNLPNFLFGLISSNKMKEIQRLVKETREDEDVLAVVPNLLYQERIYRTWDQEMTARLASNGGRADSEPPEHR